MTARPTTAKQGGFTLIETTFALFIMTIVGLGAASLFAYSVNNNSGATDRTQALALVQQRLELLRHARYSMLDSETDGTWALRARTTTETGVISAGRSYVVTTNIVNTTETLKTITVSVRAQGAGPQWASGLTSTVSVMCQRARAR
jgi:Tfp pilus assembly protein PilV